MYLVAKTFYFTSDKPHYPYELPKGWAWCKLSDCCHIAGRIGFRGYTKDDLVEFQKGAITLSPSNIIDGEMDYNKCTYISWDKYEESPEIEVLEGDILLVKTGSSFGKCALVDKLPWKSTINPQFVILKYISINEQYLTWVLQSSYARNNYNDFVLGTAIPTFTQVVLGNMPIPLPPISEQLKIVNKLKHLFLSINSLENNKKSLCTLIKELKSKVLDLAIHGKLVPQDPTDEPAAELLKRINPKAEITCDNGHYQKLPEGWCLCLLNDVLKEVFAGGDKPLIFSKNKSEENYIPIYANGTENKGLLGFTNKAQVYERCLTISARGTIGFTCIREVPFVPIVRLITAIPLPVIDLLFLKHQIDTMLSYTEGSSIPQLTIPTIKRMLIILPPLKEQLRIVAKIEELFALLDTIKAQL